MEADQTRAVVVLSGGQDSTTCLAWARSRFDTLWAITFDYGQRHRVELDAAATIAREAGVVEHRVVPITGLAELGGSAMLADDPTAAEAVGESGAGGLPNTFVPGRNLVFLTYAAAWAWQLGVSELVTGVCQTDYSGYPDCRETTMHALQNALNAGMDGAFTIHTPLMHMTKAESVQLAIEHDALPLLAYSHTCYNGVVPPCGHCPACELRAKGFAEAGIPDPLLERLADR